MLLVKERCDMNFELDSKIDCDIRRCCVEVIYTWNDILFLDIQHLNTCSNLLLNIVRASCC